MILRTRRALGAGTIALTTVAALMAVIPAASAGNGITTSKVPGIQGEISCLNATTCFTAGYNNHSLGDIVTINSGKAGKVTVFKHSEGIDYIGCAEGKGCVAVGSTSNDVGTLVVTIDKKGKIGKPQTLHTAVGAHISAISCTTAKFCGVAGYINNGSKAKIQVGTWNGKKFAVSSVKTPKKPAIIDMTGVSCIKTTCTAVGYTVSPAVGVSVTTKHGKPGATSTFKGTQLNDVACTSAAKCYAVGFAHNNGFLGRIAHGKLSGTTTFTPDPAGVSCSGKTCVAAGLQNDPGVTQPFDGSLVTITGGKLVSADVESDSQGYTGIDFASPGHFVAVGAGGVNEKSYVVTSNLAS